MQSNRLLPEERKVLNSERRFGTIFGTAVLAVGGMVALFFYYGSNNPGGWPFRIMVGAGVFASVIYYLTNRKLDRDLRYGEKRVVRREVLSKGRETVRTESLVKGFATHDERFERHYIIIGNHKHFIDRELYRKIEPGGHVELHYAARSKCLLAIKKSEPN